MVSKDWMFVSSISMFAAILVIVEYAAVESENPTKSRLDNEISRQRTINFLQGAKITTEITFPRIFPYFQQKNFRIFFPSVKTAVCLIPKNGRTVMLLVSCLLKVQEIRKEPSYKSVPTHKAYFRRPKGCVRQNNDSEKYNNIAFIRDPIKRFISGYLFVCKRRKDCFGCGLDFGCFVKTLYFCWTTNMTYSEMCAHAAPNLHMHYHLSPQVNYCNISDDVKVFKYSRENINNFLLSASKPLLSEEEYKQLLRWLNQKSYHAANEQDAEDLENLIRSNRTLTSMLAQLCFADYKMFEIDLPQFIIDFKLYENVDN